MICWKRRDEAKTKRPVIDETLCTRCGLCTKACPHGVYDAAQAPRPVAVNPSDCVPDCKECADVCPDEAITYIDENGAEITVGCNFCGGCF